MRIVEDFRAFTENGGISKKIATLLFNPCFHSICLFRCSNFLYRCHLDVISKILWYLNRMLFHVDIDYRADLAGGFVLVHGLGTVIGCEVCSKGRLTVYQGVTIGGNCGKVRIDSDGKTRGQPIFGKNVTIYTDVSIFGPVVIGDNVVIKAKSLITHDVSQQCASETDGG